METGNFGGTSALTSDASDYDETVSQLIEHGTSYNGVVPSFSEWRKDAYLMYNKPSVSLEDLMGMTRTDGMARALMLLLTLPIKMALANGKLKDQPFFVG